MKIEYLNNHPVVQEVICLLSFTEVYIVGGAVRNCLMGLPIKDLDFATKALPEEIESVLKSNGYKPILTGKAFGTIRVIISGMEVEITTYRSGEKYSRKNRKPSVTFGQTILEDLQRRDFTLNAMAYHPTLGLIDPFNGFQALQKKILDTPLEPEKTFSDDPLRMLRALRFQSTYGFVTTKTVFDAIKAQAHKTLYLSVERIKIEMDKLLVGENVDAALHEFVDSRLANYILPELIPMVGMTQNTTYHNKDVFAHTLSVVKNCPPTPIMRWAGLLHDIAKPLTKIVTDTGIHFYHHEDLGAKMVQDIAIRFKFSTDEREMLKNLVQYHMRPNLYRSDWKDEAIRKFKRQCEPFLTELLDLSRADITSMNPIKIEKALTLWQELKDRLTNEPSPLKKCPLSGKALMERFHLAPGPIIGVIQTTLMKRIEGGVNPQNLDMLWTLAAEELGDSYNESN